jgi:hypothetical protein
MRRRFPNWMDHLRLRKLSLVKLPIEKMHGDCLGSKETLRRRLSLFAAVSLRTYLPHPN